MNWRGSSIAVRVMSSSIAVLTVLILLSGGVLYFYGQSQLSAAAASERQIVQQNLHAKGRLLSDIVSNMASEAIMALDLYALQHLATEASRDEEVAAIQIYDESGMLLHETSKEVANSAPENLVSVERDVVTDAAKMGVSKKIGLIRIVLSNHKLRMALSAQEDRARRSRSGLLFGTFAIAIIIDLLIAATLLAIIRGLVVRPIANVIRGLTGGSQQVASTSEQLSQFGRMVSDGANHQASSLEQISASLEEMSAMTRQNADNAGQADKLMREVRQSVESGSASMEQLFAAMGDIRDSSNETAKIIKTIDEIAMQTNLLALNAAVEAARAGDAGRGFAVVADEVRTLAQRSAEAARTTSSLIERSQHASGTGVDLAEQSSEAMRGIAVSASKAADLVGEIAEASKEQAQGIEQLNTAISSMEKITQSNAANSEEAASASRELNDQANELDGMVAELVGVVSGRGNAAHTALPAPLAPEARGTNRSGQNVSDVPAGRPARRAKTGEDAVAVPARPTRAMRAIFVRPSGGRDPEQVIPLKEDEPSEDF